MINSDDNRILTTKDYWARYYVAKDISEETHISQLPQKDQPSFLRRYTQNYGHYLWEIFYDKYFSIDETKSIVEIGSAPGTNAVRFYKKFNYKTYGIEYTDDGVGLNRALFKKNGIPEENVIHADFLDTDFQTAYKNTFDMVVSFGFLEHFMNPKKVVEYHINMLKPGGMLLISIPNFRYLNFSLKSFFGTEFIKTHNLSLMDYDTFKNCFLFDNFEIFECRYFGGFQFPQPSYTKPWKRIIERIMGKLQLIVNVFFRTLFKNKGWESRYFSSCLVCIGRKTPN